MLALLFPFPLPPVNPPPKPTTPSGRRSGGGWFHRPSRPHEITHVSLASPPQKQRPRVLPPSAEEALAENAERRRGGDAEGGEENGSTGLGSGSDGGGEGSDQVLPSPLRRESLPRHVAIIMDGNSRWARARGLPASAGHEAGYRSLKEIVKLSCKWGIRALTVFAFSSENWLRPKPEVDFLMMLFQDVLEKSIGEFVRDGIRVCIIGDSSKLPKSLQKLAADIQEITRKNSRLDLIVAINYSGRSDIVQACQKIANKVRHGLLEPADITESLIAQELETKCVIDFPYPDLLIRTSGELRLSNFLLWESAYTELYFAKTHWPDFGEAEYVEALSSFQIRQRRFGLRTV